VVCNKALSLCSVRERAQIKKSGKLLQRGSSSCCCLCFFLLQCRKFRTRAALQIITMTMQLSSFIKCCCSTAAAATYTSVLLFVVGCCFTATLLPGSSAAVATNTRTTSEVMINLQSGLEIIRKILWSIWLSSSSLSRQCAGGAGPSVLQRRSQIKVWTLIAGGFLCSHRCVSGDYNYFSCICTVLLHMYKDQIPNTGQQEESTNLLKLHFFMVL
jgi:hypothetical protein